MTGKRKWTNRSTLTRSYGTTSGRLNQNRRLKVKLTYPRGKRKFELHKSDINAIHKARILCASFVECGETDWQTVVDAIDARLPQPEPTTE